MLVGYARVFTLDQNLDLQRDAMERAGCERLFEEKKSGKAGTKRPSFEEALAFLRPEDALVVWKLDRLGRFLVEMMRTIDGLRLVNPFAAANDEASPSSSIAPPRMGGPPCRCTAPWPSTSST